MSFETRYFGIMTALLVGALSVGGCSADPDSLGDGSGDDQGGGAGAGGGGAGGGGGAAAQCLQTPTGKGYVGFGGTKLEADRLVEPMGANRARFKPYEVLGGEYTRALGTAPASLASNADTFGTAPARWYEESQGGAVILSTAFDVAFEGCLKFTATDPAFAAAPDGTSAPAQCTTMMRKFWSKDAQPDEISACASYATTGLAKEKDPRRQWAYVCSAVMTSTRFLTF